MQSDSDAYGFTLLELLVVVAILGMIIVSLTAGVRFAGSAWQRQQQTVFRQGDVDAVETALRRLLASAMRFQGNAEQVSFVAHMPAALERGGLYDIELLLEGDRLALSWQPHFNGFTAVPPQREDTTLLDGVGDLRLAYYSNPGGWKHESRDRKRSPALIAIEVWLDGGRSWMPLIVAPMTEVQQTAIK